MSVRTATFRLPGPLATFATFRLHRHGPGDPTIRIEDRALWRATLTPDGPATIHVEIEGDRVRATAWGRGAGWMIDRAGLLVGKTDRSTLRTVHPRLRELQRQIVGMRIGATQRVMECLVPA